MSWWICWLGGGQGGDTGCECGGGGGMPILGGGWSSTMVDRAAAAAASASAPCVPLLSLSHYVQGLGLTHDPGSLGGVHRGNLNVLWFNIGRQQVKAAQQNHSTSFLLHPCVLSVVPLHIHLYYHSIAAGLLPVPLHSLQTPSCTLYLSPLAFLLPPPLSHSTLCSSTSPRAQWPRVCRPGAQWALCCRTSTPCGSACRCCSTTWGEGGQGEGAAPAAAGACCWFFGSIHNNCAPTVKQARFGSAPSRPSPPIPPPTLRPLA